MLKPSPLRYVYPPYDVSDISNTECSSIHSLNTLDELIDHVLFGDDTSTITPTFCPTMPSMTHSVTLCPDDIVHEMIDMEANVENKATLLYSFEEEFDEK